MLPDLQLRGFAVSHWWDDPHARGAWSVPGPRATPTSRADLGRPVSGRVILAGEATSAHRPAMTHGAWEEGRRAADWLLAQGHRRAVVIGAGFAGLAAAERLRLAGLAPVVLEARSRIGGRVWSRPLGGAVVESGANWLQQGAANPLQAAAQALGLTLVPTDFHAPRDLGPAEALADLALPDLAGQLDRALSRAPATARLGDVLAAWAARAGAPPRRAIARIVTATIGLEAGIPPAEMTVHSLREPGVGEGDAWVPAGYDRLLAPMAAGLDLRLERPVTALDQTAAGVRLTGPWGALPCDAVIVTAPVAVLQAGAIAFTPPLPPAHQAALAALTTGRVEKVSLWFASRFWPATTSGYLRLHGPAPHQVSEWLDLTDAVGTPILTGIFEGEWARTLWQGSDAEIATRIARLWQDQARI